MRISFEVPGETGAKERQPNVVTIHDDHADNATEAIFLVPLNRHIALKGKFRQLALGRLPERLPLLRCIDSCEANLFLDARWGQDSHSVPISDTDNPAAKFVSGQVTTREQCGDEEQRRP